MFVYVKPRLPADLGMVQDFALAAVAATAAWGVAWVVWQFFVGRARLRLEWKVNGQPVQGSATSLDFADQKRHIVSVGAVYDGFGFVPGCARLVSKWTPVVVDLRFLPADILLFGRERIPPGAALNESTLQLTLAGGLEPGTHMVAQFSLTEGGMLPMGVTTLKCHVKFGRKNWLWPILIHRDCGIEHFEIRS